ncbi:beta strand repeat-containing protein [Noviherbaspirillum saxi]|uniref:Haemolysin-type calcium binding-related domain-containing protein n=1 Tax=Noviherbaspirillum saxi TaxID=2320863 RepID=A0A3A3G4R6_9BURK|nr:calcium-binding protein [Noviherbaspirillum saxi]RJF95180.1 hypothetical protein D3871_17155 [Noviherbaspirillum saxi]
MTVSITSQDLTQDSFKETLVKFGEKAFAGGGAYMSALGDSILQQAGSAQARAELFQQQLSNLDNLAAHIVDEMKAVNSSGLDTAILSRYNALTIELGKVDGFIDSAKQAGVMADNLHAVGKSLGAVVGSLELLAALRSNASQAEISKEAFVAGAGIAAGIFAGTSLTIGVAVAVIVGAGAKLFWDNFIAPNVSDAGIDLSRPFWDSLFDSLGLNPVQSKIKQNTLISELQVAFEKAETTTSPLILDLDGDGVETISRTADIHFDHDGNQFAENTGWVGKDDGLLVWDRNGNGKIDSGQELFGSETLLANGSKAANGFAALSELDGNNDGKVDANDAAYAQLRIWKDGDSNAVVSDGELITLGAGGIQSMETAYTTQAEMDAQGNQHLQVSQYIRTDGSARKVTDVWFSVDQARTINQNTIVVSETISALPDLQGFGNVRSLHQAMAIDTSGRLQSLVEAFASETSADARANIMTTLVYAWAGVENIDPNSRAATQIYGNVIGDARKLATLEAFLGEGYLGTWCWGERDPNPHGNAAPILIKAFDKLVAEFSRELLAQTHFNSLYNAFGLVWNASSASLEIDVTEVVAALQSKYDANQEAGATLMREFGVALKQGGAFGTKALAALHLHGSSGGTEFELLLSQMGWSQTTGGSGDNTLYGDVGRSNVLQGLGGNDRLYGNNLDDILEGGTGDDWLYGEDANDTLEGGLGKDVLSGGKNDDTYVFSLGDGNDTINENANEGADVLKFGTGISPIDVEVSREIMDVVLRLNGTDSVRIVGYFNKNAIDQIKFSDGTSWDFETVANKASYIGTAGTDYMYAVTGVANRINGLGGNDSIYGADKDDVLNGGAGNDVLEGSGGNDTYVFNLGDGSDAIAESTSTSGGTDILRLGAGLDAASTQIERQNSDLTLVFNGTDKVRIVNYFNKNTVDQIQFADGTVWDHAAITDRLTYNGTAGADYLYSLSGVANRINGLGGNDTLYGADKDDVLNGGVGNDVLEGSGGNDTYVFNLGDGSDAIAESTSMSGGTDILKLGAGLDAAGTQIERQNSDLTLVFNGTDKVRIVNYFNKNTVDQIQFADGTVWDYNAVVALLPYNGTDGADYMYGLSGVANRINGLGGNDSIYGADKDDVLNGGAGNDVLEGSGGNDTYVFNLGDGSDAIAESTSTSGGTDILRLGAGLDAASTQIERQNSDLTLVFNGTDKVRIVNYFNKNTVDQIQFADGTVWDHAAITDRLTYNGTAGADYLYSLSGVANRINGLGGNDTLYGADKDDVLNGGVGNDVLEGSGGNDTYVFNLGDGSDAIAESTSTSGGTDILRLGAGLDAASTQIERQNSDLTLVFNGTDKVRIVNYFNKNTVDQIQFADGTVWDHAAITDRLTYNGTAGADYLYSLSGVANRINGLGGNDTLYGADKDDVLNGGAGNDVLEGSGGNDTYVFNLGDGSDAIAESTSMSGGTDILKLGAGLDAAGTQIERQNSDLTLVFNGTDKVRIVNYFNKNTVDQIQFADGTVWDHAAVTDRLTYNGTAGADYLYSLSGVANRINGLGGNDSLYGADKDDVLNGGVGNDVLEGSGGNDTYVFNLGDGSDAIAESTSTSGGTDILKLGAGLDAAGTQIERQNSDLTLVFNGTDKVRIVNYFNKNTVDQIQFADGTVWDHAAVTDRLTYNGTAGADYLYSLSGVANRINGLGGNDSLYGADKDDVLNGGVGNDVLEGSGGNDTYVFNLGDGSDAIAESTSTSGGTDILRLGAGLDAASTQIERQNSDLTLVFNGTDKVRIVNYFNKNTVDQIQFADGTVWDHAAVTDRLTYNGTAGADYLYSLSGVANRINGLGGNDTLYGADKDDVLNGGAGNDQLYGGAGNDVLEGGSGNDLLAGEGGNDIFRFTGPLDGIDTVSNFVTGSDVIHIIGSGFGLTGGDGVSFFTGTSTPATSGVSAQFLYNSSSGALYFDRDGTDLAYGAVQVATLTGSKTLVATDFVVVEV